MVFTIYGCGGHLGPVTKMPRSTLAFPLLALINQAVSEKMFEIADDDRQTDAGACSAEVNYKF